MSIQPMSYSLLFALQNNKEQKNISVRVQEKVQFIFSPRGKLEMKL